jgi:hypothetical protein
VELSKRPDYRYTSTIPVGTPPAKFRHRFSASIIPRFMKNPSVFPPVQSSARPWNPLYPTPRETTGMWRNGTSVPPRMALQAPASGMHQRAYVWGSYGEDIPKAAMKRIPASLWLDLLVWKILHRLGRRPYTGNTTQILAGSRQHRSKMSGGNRSSLLRGIVLTSRMNSFSTSFLPGPRTCR